MENIIEVKNLTKKFNGLKAVDNISFSVKKGEIFAFLGPNGAGKTTTIKMLTTLLKPTAGEIIVNGFNIKGGKRKIRKSFGIVFQDPSLDDQLTAYENMYFHAVLYNVPKEDRKRKTEELLKFVDLWDRKKDVVKKFSGGMKRRLEIARGLLHYPEILFLDEPTLGLDPQTRTHIWDYIKKINKDENVTVFLTSHYMDEVERVADRIAIIDKGKIIGIGTLDDLREQASSNSLEEIFLNLTGKDIRDEHSSPEYNLRRRHAFKGK